MKTKQSIIEENATDESTLPLKSKRKFLKNLGILMGTGALAQLTSGNALAVALAYDAKADSAKKAGKLFNQKQMQVLADICAVVLPKTDTPSAAELDVHGFIDHQLYVCYEQQQQSEGLAIVDKIDQQSQANFAKSFTAISVEEQTQLLVSLEVPSQGFSAQDKKHFQELKSLLVFGYFTTEIGATQALSYQAVPGGFKGSIPYDSVGKSYGSLAYY